MFQRIVNRLCIGILDDIGFKHGDGAHRLLQPLGIFRGGNHDSIQLLRGIHQLKINGIGFFSIHLKVTHLPFKTNRRDDQVVLAGRQFQPVVAVGVGKCADVPVAHPDVHKRDGILHLIILYSPMNNGKLGLKKCRYDAK